MRIYRYHRNMRQLKLSPCSFRVIITSILNTMYTLETFNVQLVSIMNALANDVLAEINLSTTVHVGGASNGEDEGKLDTLVRIKCIEASNTIMKLFKEIITIHEDPKLPLYCQPEGVNETGATSGEDVCETPRGGRDSTFVHCERYSMVLPREEDSTSPLCPAVDLDHHYIRSSASLSTTAMREKDRSVKRKKMKRVEPNIIITKLSRVQHMCRHCGALFSAIIDLRDHERHVHQVVERPYSCDYCEKTFSHKPHRDRHHRLHRGERMFQCEICGKAYTTISQLKTHKQTHTEKSFICDICGNGFYQSGHLTRHKLVHEDVKPFRCDTCGKGFTQAEGLKNHQMTHTDERELCPICGKSYRNLKQHMINKHAEELPPEDARRKHKKYTCEVAGCSKKFLYPSLLNLHKKRTHARKLNRRDALEKEVKGEQTLGDHKNIQTGERPYMCMVCGSTFGMASNLERHKSIHTGEMPYSCFECGKRFRLLDFLKTHERVHMKHKTGMFENAPNESTGASVS